MLHTPMRCPVPTHATVLCYPNCIAHTNTLPRTYALQPVRMLSENNTSPLTGLPLTSTALVPAYAMRNIIEAWRELYGKEIKPSHVTIGKVVGRGSFKTVYEATLNIPGSKKPMVVAAAMMHAPGDMLAEAATLLKISKHPRLIGYIGSYINAEGMQVLVTEFAAQGSLKALLLDDDVAETLTVAHQWIIASQVATGMESLAHSNMIHRDLAARNVLVTKFDGADPSATSVKISDFGLTITSQGTHAYAQEAVSARWAAPESLRRSQFSQQSDVWSFGVLCWELLSQGDDPYFLESSDKDVRTIVIGGGNLERPDECSDSFWAIMGQCWEKSPKNRPSFTEIVAQFSQGTSDQV